MPEWTTACPDWAERLQSGRSIIPPPIFPDEAEAGLSIMRELRIVDAPGSPRMGDACGDWVFELAASIFGAYDAESGRRLITEWFVMLPKKNFKSGLAAGIMLTSLIRNWRQSAEFTILAPTVEVANNSYGPARDMVQYQDSEDGSELADLIHVQSHIKTLTHRDKQAMLKVIAADETAAAGKKSVGTLVEELWLFGKNPRAKEMFREALGGLASRPEGFVIWLTTQSDDPPAGVFKEKLQYARDVRDGKIHDPQFVPVIFEHPPEMVKRGDHRKLENLALVNPNLGYSVDRAFLERSFRQAEIEGEASLRGFLAKHANVEVGLALRSDRWAGADWWERCGGDLRGLADLLERSEVVTVGIDGGGLDDLLGLAFVGREREPYARDQHGRELRRWLVWGHAWAHESVLERHKQEVARLRDFAAAGDLTLVQRLGDDVSDVAELVLEAKASGKLAEKGIGVDPVGIGSIVDALIDGGVEQEAIVGVSQGWRLAGAIKTAERRLADGSLMHARQPLMAWCVSNARIEPRANSVLITKAASGVAKIDPLMALLNAVTLMAMQPQAQSAPQIIDLGI